MKPLFIYLLLSLATSASAQKTSTVGVGATSCGAYMRLSSGANEDTRNVIGSYLQGYLSGINAAMLANQKQSKSIPDVSALISYMDTYCARKSLERVDSGIIDLYTQIR